jgi:4-hydroxybenzoate-CoA ligase
MNSNAVSFFVDRHALGGCGDRAAILHERGRVTYGELADEINRAGNYLKGLGVQPEQRVVLQVHDSPEWVYFFMAAVKIGAIAVPVNTFCNARTLAFYLNDSRAPVLITHREYSDSVQSLLGDAAPFLRHVIYVEDAAWKAQSLTLEPVDVSTEDSAFWLYTSGSTGVPKAVVHSHAGTVACADGFGRSVLAITGSDRCYSASKLFFAYGLGNSIIFPFSAGAACILNARRSEAESVVRTIREFKPTLFFAVPTLYGQLLGSPELNRELFARVRMCVSAGEALADAVFDSWLERAGHVLYEGIGTTEALHIFCSNKPGAHRRGTSGTPVDGYELRIVDARGVDVEGADAGRLLVRGATLAKGYWNRREAQAQAFFGDWLATGDIYQRTGEGYFKYVGRQDDAFKTSGLWVSPGEIEHALLSCPHAKEAAVVAVRNATGTAAAKACVVLSETAGQLGQDHVRREIYLHLEATLSRYKIPAFIEFLPALPRTATGKISRAELRRDPGQTFRLGSAVEG